MADLTYSQAAEIAASGMTTPLGAAEQVYNGLDTLVSNGLGGIGYSLLGRLSPEGKQTIVAQEAQANVAASGGTLSLADATAQAQSDVTTVLMDANADPSQNPTWVDNFGPYLTYAAIILALILAIKIVGVFK